MDLAAGPVSVEKLTPISWGKRATVSQERLREEKKGRGTRSVAGKAPGRLKGRCGTCQETPSSSKKQKFRLPRRSGDSSPKKKKRGEEEGRGAPVCTAGEDSTRGL